MRQTWVLLGFVGLLTLTGCVGSNKIDGPRDASGLDKKLSTFVYIEEGDIASLIVNTRIARYRDNSDYVPFQISVANRGLRQISLSRESFELTDEEGNRYPCVGPRELLDGYEFLDLDRSPTLADLEGMVFDRFAAFTRYPSNFSPTRSAIQGTVRDTVNLPKFGYLVDFVYFPKPPTGVKGHRFELTMTAPELEDPIFVKFEVK